MKLEKETLHELLVEPGHITEEQFAAATEKVEKENVSFERAITESGVMSDVNYVRTIADHNNYHFVDLKDIKIEEKYLKQIPKIVAYAQRAVLFDGEGDVLKLATTDVENYEFIKLLEKSMGKNIDVYYATEAGINESLRYYKGDLREKISEHIERCTSNRQEGDIVALVDLFLEYAHDSHSSDIHIEPLDKDVLVRFRIDGILHEVAMYPKEIHEQIVFRIKILAHLQTDEHSTAQDGRFEQETDGMTFDIRVSVMPVTGGENVVMRLLISHENEFLLDKLGLSNEDYKKVVNAANKPHGMILTVGPTGSGKTTTLYTILGMLNNPEVNIMTIEDPVEYDMERIQQTQVNQKKDLTFATGLRSIVRQDPDIIMVGEIRDEETADIAVNAAMTGHLLLSTLHTNDAATTFPRLIEMGIEPFLVASSVNVIVAQRLVRKICTRCRKSRLLNEEEQKLLNVSADIQTYFKDKGIKDISKVRLYEGAGCKVCGDTGFSGRVGLFEVMEIGEGIRSLVAQKTPAASINAKAQELGMTSLLHDGLEKVIDGATTLEEVVKATRM